MTALDYRRIVLAAACGWAVLMLVVIGGGI